MHCWKFAIVETRHPRILMSIRSTPWPIVLQMYVSLIFLNADPRRPSKRIAYHICSSNLHLNCVERASNFKIKNIFHKEMLRLFFCLYRKSKFVYDAIVLIKFDYKIVSKIPKYATAHSLHVSEIFNVIRGFPHKHK
jgi:hypothetical protein